MNAAGGHWRIHAIRSLSARYADSWSAWLHPRETDDWQSFTTAERRAAWCWGRVAAKSLLLAHPSLPTAAAPRDLCIHSRSDNGALGTRPRVTLGGDELPVFLSISHTRRRVAVAISMTPIGIDVVEEDDARSPALKSWMTANELIGCTLKECPDEDSSSESEHRAECWAAKEAAFKTLPFGTPFQPRRIRLERITRGRMRWRFSNRPRAFDGEVRMRRGLGFVLAVAQQSSSEDFPMTTSA